MNTLIAMARVLDRSEREIVCQKIDELKAEIESLPSEEFAEIFRWLSEKDWERWDKEIEADSQAGRLDFLVREAREEKSKGNLKDL
jgi:Fe-S cluster biosynthesis and repair protein YggX